MTDNEKWEYFLNILYGGIGYSETIHRKHNDQLYPFLNVKTLKQRKLLNKIVVVSDWSIANKQSRIEFDYDAMGDKTRNKLIWDISSELKEHLNTISSIIKTLNIDECTAKWIRKYCFLTIPRIPTQVLWYLAFQHGPSPDSVTVIPFFDDKPIRSTVYNSQLELTLEYQFIMKKQYLFTVDDFLNQSGLSGTLDYNWRVCYPITITKPNPSQQKNWLLNLFS